MTETPHFDRPFRLSGTRVAVVEQDSDEELVNCVWAIASTEVGSRDEAPEFGVPDLPFQETGFIDDALVASVQQWEPRLESEARSVLDGMEIATNLEVE